VVVAALVDGGADGSWSESLLASGDLCAPHLLPVEVTNTLRRAVQRRVLSRDVAALAHADLLDLRIELFPFAPFGSRIWALRDNVTAYDAWYVALAETLGAPLATLDKRLSRAAGPRCEFRVPKKRGGLLVARGALGLHVLREHTLA